jgi:hypothetical protein
MLEVVEAVVNVDSETRLPPKPAVTTKRILATPSRTPVTDTNKERVELSVFLAIGDVTGVGLGIAAVAIPGAKVDVLGNRHIHRLCPMKFSISCH